MMAEVSNGVVHIPWSFFALGARNLLARFAGARRG
jgi:hypothetical protein